MFAARAPQPALHRPARACATASSRRASTATSAPRVHPVKPLRFPSGARASSQRFELRSFRELPRGGVAARAKILGNGSKSDESDDDEAESTSQSASVQLPRSRRRVQMTFTCNKCDARTMRMINPDVLEKGTMWVQCGECEVWHQIVDNLGLIFDFTGDYEDLKDVVKNAKRMQPPQA